MSALNNNNITVKGLALLAKAQIGIQIEYKKIVIGDGYLGDVLPAKLTSIINEKMNIPISTISLNSDGNALITGAFDNANIQEGFYYRELGLYAIDPDEGEILYSYGNAGNYAEWIPPTGGVTFVEKQIEIITLVGQATQVTAVVNSGVYALKDELVNVNDNLSNLIENNNIRVDAISVAALATGTATEIELNIQSVTAYTPLMKICFMASGTNATNAKTINVNGISAKPFYKAGTTSSPSVTANKIYNVVLSADGTCFFLQASAEGNSTAENVLAGKIFSNDDDTGITGTMVDNGSVGTVTLASEGSEYLIPKGYHNGLGKIKTVITGLLSSVIKAGTTVGGILGTFTADASAQPSHMLAGVTAYVNGSKVTGTIPIAPTYPVENEASQVHCYSSPPNANEGNHNLFLQVPKGYYDNNWLGARIANLTAGNIKAGVVLGDDASITGTFTSDATATSGHILAGQSAYVNGNKVTGTIPSRGAVTIMPSRVNQTISAGQYLNGVQTIAGDANLVDWKIRYGFTLFGVVGRSGEGSATSSRGNAYLTGTALNMYSAEPVAIAWLRNATGTFVFNASENANVCYRVGSTETYPCSYTYPTFTITGLPDNMGMSKLYMIGKRLDGEF